jgi:hypothetical protein
MFMRFSRCRPSDKKTRVISRPLTYALAISLAVGSAVACGDDEEGAGGGKGGSSGSAGKGGSSGTGTGGKATGGSSGTGTGGKSTGGGPGTGGTAAGGTSGTSGTGGAGDEGGAGAGGQGGEGGRPEGCNNLGPAMGPSVGETQRSGSVPTATGGPIDNGTYFLTGWDVYPPETADAGNHRTITLVITNGHAELVGVEDAGQIPRLSVDVETSGPSITLTHTCPDSTVDMTHYTATQGAGAQFRVVRAESGRSRVEIYTKQ